MGSATPKLDSPTPINASSVAANIGKQGNTSQYKYSSYQYTKPSNLKQ